MRDTFNEPARTIRVTAAPDVLVVGGGAAGVAAAIAAARAGATTLLVERYGFLGGTLSAVTLGTLCGAHLVDGDAHDAIVAGVYQEMVDRLVARAAALPARRWLRNVSIPYDPVALRHVLDEMVTQSGVGLLLHTLVVEAPAADGRVGAVVIENKAGRSAITPRIVIDCSGDADVAARAGAAFTVGDSGATQFASTMVRFGGVDTAAFDAIARARRLELLEQAAADGYPLPRTSAGLQIHPLEGTVHANVTRVKRPDGSTFDLLDPHDLSAAEVEGRRQAHLYEEVLRRYMPGFGRARIADMGTQIGVRETRLVEGEHRLTEAQVRGCVKPDDAIACCAWPMEQHGADRGTVWDWLPEGDWYGIPYGCLTVRGFANLLVAGRCLSATHAAQSSARVAATCMAMGQAAGQAAALALRAGDDIRRVGTGRLRDALQSAGALLAPRGSP